MNTLTKVNLKYLVIKTLLIIGCLYGATNLLAGTLSADSLKADIIVTDSPENEMDINLKIGDAYYENSRNVEAMDYYKKALAASRAEGNFRSIAICYMKIGVVYMELGSFDLAMDNFLRARELTGSKYNDLRANIDINIGVLLEQTGSFNEALKYLFNSIKYYEKVKTDDVENLLQAYSSVGVVYGRQEKPDSALFYLNRALKIAEESKFKIDQGALLNNLGAIFYKMEKTDSALYYYQASLEIFDEINSAKGVAISKLNIAQIYTGQQRFDEAEKLLLESMTIFKTTGALFYLKDVYLNYTDLLKEVKRFEEAFEYSLLFSELNDSLMNQELMAKLNAAESRNIIEIKERELINLQRENELIQSRRKMIIISLISLIIAGVFIVISQFSKIKNSRLKNQLLKKEQEILIAELDYKKKNLESFALHIVQKNQFFNDIRKEFRRIKLNEKDPNKSKIRDINLKISQYFRINQEQKKFMTFAEEVNQLYFIQLNEKFPDLTEKEKQLCAFINLNLSSKDIAVLNNVSERAVVMARYRMRKKLDVPKEMSLRDFLKSM